MPKKTKIRIANAGGYWGDDLGAISRQVMGGPIDYVTIDFLAEITMSIMQKQRSRDPKAGYARDFVEVIVPLLPAIVEKNVRIVTLIDRLVHRAEIVELQGQSYRLKEAQERQARKAQLRKPTPRKAR